MSQQASDDQSPSLLRAESIVHDYAGVIVLHEVDLDIRAGEIHALLGQNGSGKSTLIKVLTGAHSPSSGRLWRDGEETHFHTPQAATAAGVAVVHQNYNVFPDLTVAQNLLATTINPPRRLIAANGVDHPRWRRKVTEILERLGVEVNPDTLVSKLGPAQRKFVEIARAMLVDPQILILDEPTASLEPEAAAQVMKLMSNLRSHGIGVVFVSHRLDEVLANSDRYTILRDGRVVSTGEVDGLTPSRLTELMIGRPPAVTERLNREVSDEIRLRLSDVSVGGPTFTLDLRAGEIMAVTGLVGSGASSLVAMVGGDIPLQGRGSIEGKETRLHTARDAQRAGIGFIPEDRKGRGMLMEQSCAVNVGLSSLGTVSRRGVVSRARLHHQAHQFRERLRIKMTDVAAPASSLSGGNQQKLMIARLLAADVQVMAIQEPTQGVDVGGRAQIHDLIREFTGRGGSVLLFSTDADEVLALADTVCVFRHGHLTHIVDGASTDEHHLTALISGVEDDHDPGPSPTNS